ncbi:MAG: M48 family metallopeptidase [Methylotetracoccus sp.]
MIAVAALSVALSGCGSSSKARKTVAAAPLATNVPKMGAKAFDQYKAKTPLDEERKTNAYIVCVAEAVVRDVGGDWEVAFFRRDAAGAFVLPGGKIGVYSGTLKLTKNQHQVAAILAHGLAHVLAKHPEARVADDAKQHPDSFAAAALDHPGSPDAQRVSSLLGMFPTGTEVPFDRAHESEANIKGLDLMARAGFDPREAVVFWRSIERGGTRTSDFVDLHPSYGTRIAELEGHVSAASELRDRAKAAGKKPECDRLR